MAGATGPVRIVPYALPFGHRYVTATGALDRRQAVLLEVAGGDGLAGLGEAVPMSLRGGDPLATVVADLERWAADRDGPLPTTPPARCAVLTALADLEAQRLGIPLWQHLSPDTTPRPVRCNATITAGPVADVVSRCENWAAAGFRVFKLKAGADEAVAVATAVRSALGPAAAIRIDANGTWGEAAGRILGELEPVGIELVEEPVTGLERLARLAAETTIPLVADESVNGPEEAARAASLGAVAAATVKLSKTGSLDASLGGALPTYLSSALDGPVGIAAAVHAAQALGDLPWGEAAHGLATQRLFTAWPAEAGPELDGDLLTVPDAPGLGLRLDERLLDRLRL